MMQWRPLVLLLTGFAVICLVSLFQEVPWSHPRQIHVDHARVEQELLNDMPDDSLLLHTDTRIYLASIWYEHGSAAPHTGVDVTKAAVTGRISLVQRLRDPFFQTTHPALPSPPPEEAIHSMHSLRGPISKVSFPSNGNNTLLRFAVLYHILNNEEVEHVARIYYEAADTGRMEYKDLTMPGTTMIDAFTLESDSILYSRDPDNYRFRVLPLPYNLAEPPHSSDAAGRPLEMQPSYPGDPVRPHQQPSGALEHDGIVARLHPSQTGATRVFSLDLYKTQLHFHINMTLVDNTTTLGQPRWDLWASDSWTYNIFLDEAIEYMAFVDGTHFHQERMKQSVPRLSFAQSADRRTLVFPISHQSILTFDFKSDIESMSKHREDSEEDHEVFSKHHPVLLYTEIQFPQFDADLRGVRLNDKGNLLAVWTETEIYIYRRGGVDGAVEQCDSMAVKWPNTLLQRSGDIQMSTLDWCPPMTVPRTSTHAAISSASFWSEPSLDSNSDSNFLLIAFKDGTVASYFMDEKEPQEAVGFSSFLRNRWDVWIAMSCDIIIFIAYEFFHSSL